MEYYTLMHKNIPVADILISSEHGRIEKVEKVFEPDHLPLATRSKHEGLEHTADRASLDIWWIGRSIPASRQGVSSALNQLGIKSPTFLLTKAFGLSLSDHYWIKPKGKEIRWEDINFFQNAFSDDIGALLFGKEIEHLPHFNFTSPDNTSDGVLKKKWMIAENDRLLIKGGSRPFNQEPYNEVVATKIMERLGINHVPYHLVEEDGEIYSACKSFTDTETELVSAYRISQTVKGKTHANPFDEFKYSCHFVGLKGYEQDVEKMIVLDYLIANTDRHWNNFGFLRDSSTLEWKGFAPIFDSGNSLWNDEEEIKYDHKSEKSKTFLPTNKEQLNLITDLSWLSEADLTEVKKDLNDMMPLFPQKRKTKWNEILSAVYERLDDIRVLKIQLDNDISDKENRPQFPKEHDLIFKAVTERMAANPNRWFRQEAWLHVIENLIYDIEDGKIPDDLSEIKQLQIVMETLKENIETRIQAIPNHPITGESTEQWEIDKDTF